MGRIMQNGIDYTGASVVELTQAEYDALPSSKYSDGITYMIKDRYSANATKMLGVGDCYSTSEKIIGCWTDGKPLYQKTWIRTVPNTTGLFEWTDGVPSDLDTVVETSYSVRNVGEQGATPWYASASIYFDAMNNRAVSFYTSGTYNAGNPLIFTAKYTKTTDVAGSGDWTPSGVPAVHYSTDEQIIGTWVDGKTLYQKTIHYTGNINANTSVTLANVTSWNIGTVVSIRGVIKESGWGAVEMPCKEGRLQISEGSTRNLTLAMGNLSFSPADAYITIQYTKSS